VLRSSTANGTSVVPGAASVNTTPVLPDEGVTKLTPDALRATTCAPETSMTTDFDEEIAWLTRQCLPGATGTFATFPGALTKTTEGCEPAQSRPSSSGADLGWAVTSLTTRLNFEEGAWPCQGRTRPTVTSPAPPRVKSAAANPRAARPGI
jgi:hypothetical protein